MFGIRPQGILISHQSTLNGKTSWVILCICKIPSRVGKFVLKVRYPRVPSGFREEIPWVKWSKNSLKLYILESKTYSMNSSQPTFSFRRQYQSAVRNVRGLLMTIIHVIILYDKY
jgi:hypothetical protein